MILSVLSEYTYGCRVLLFRLALRAAPNGAAGNEQASVTQEISQSVSRSADGSEVISLLIKDVALKAQGSQSASNDVKTAALELSEMATQLQQLVSRFQSDENKPH